MRECNQCGKCCTIYGDGGLSATASEIDWWETHRPHIMAHVKDGKIWVDPDSGAPLQHCPWLEKLPNQNKYICRIYFDRPDDCRQYPSNITEMIRDGCEMLGPGDYKNQDQAQRTLDRLMSTSRTKS